MLRRGAVLRVPAAVALALVLAISGPGGAPSDALAPLKREHPRLVVDANTWPRLVEKQRSDPRLSGLVRLVQAQARTILEQPPVERRQVGRRLLGVSRTALERVLALAFAHRTTGEAAFARRAEREMLAAASFSDWNPSHFLDVAEMTTALALGYDWLHDALGEESRATLRRAIAEKGLRPAIEPTARHNGWQTRRNNWNQVCFGGLTLGALAIAEHDPDLARQVLARAQAGIVHGLEPYEPDGVYPEGPGYWSYGTSYQVLMIAALESALGTDWGLPDHRGLRRSAAAYVQATGTTGLLYNFADGSEHVALEPALFWFARRFGDEGLLDRQLALVDTVAQRGKVHGVGGARRLLPLAAVWWPEGGGAAAPTLPRFWTGGGPNPIGVFRSSWTDDDALYLGFKGGSADVNHGHMDAGSFVLERHGVRWARDLGAQDYESLESKQVDLWNRSQDSQRWQVFRLNNRSHNTLTIDGALHRVDGVARIVAFSDRPEAPFGVVDLSPVFAGQARRVRRGFKLLGDRAVLVQDELSGLAAGARVRWAMVTAAEVAVDGKRAVLRENGRQLEALLLSPGLAFEVIPADPPADGFNAPNPGKRMLIATATAGKHGVVGIAVALGLPAGSTAPATFPIDAWPAASGAFRPHPIGDRAPVPRPSPR